MGADESFRDWKLIKVPATVATRLTGLARVPGSCTWSNCRSHSRFIHPIMVMGVLNIEIDNFLQNDVTFGSVEPASTTEVNLPILCLFSRLVPLPHSEQRNNFLDAFPSVRSELSEVNVHFRITSDQRQFHKRLSSLQLRSSSALSRAISAVVASYGVRGCPFSCGAPTE